MTRLQAQSQRDARVETPTRLSTIVVATDFSEHAERALRWAVTLAGAHGARIVLVHVLEPTLSAIDLLEGPVTAEASRQLALAEQLIKQAKLRSCVELERGQPWVVLSEVAKRHSAELIVIGTRGRTRYKRVLLGSTADRLVRTSDVPVLVVHPSDAIAASGLNTILVPVDFSEESALATSMAMRLLSAQTIGNGVPWRLVLLHVVELMMSWPTPDIPTVMPRYWDEAESTARRRLETIAAGLRSDRVKVEVLVMRGAAPDLIEHEARSNGANLIAMGTHGRSGLQRLMIGSVAASVLHNAPCAVLTVRRPGADEPVHVESRL